MRTRRTLAAAALALALLGGAPALALAGEGQGDDHHEGFEGRTLAYQLVNLGILAGILVVFAVPAINKALAARHDQLKAALASAAAAKTEAEERLRQHDKRVAHLEEEIAQMKAGFAAEAEAEKQRLIAAAEERARRAQTETTFLIEQQVKEARQVLRHELTLAALKVADGLLNRAINASDQSRLNQSFVADVNASASEEKRA